MNIGSVNTAQAAARVKEIYPVTGQRAVDKIAKNEKVGGHDSDGFVLSATAKDFQTVKQAVAETPDVRADKIAEIKARFEKGDYKPDVSAIADKIASAGGFF